MAGFVNSISLCYFHVPISHMTGAFTRLSIDMAGLNFSEFINLSYIVFGFLFGAVFSGAVIGARNFKPSIEYSILMAIESALLFASVFLFKSKANSAKGRAAAVRRRTVTSPLRFSRPHPLPRHGTACRACGRWCAG